MNDKRHVKTCLFYGENDKKMFLEMLPDTH